MSLKTMDLTTEDADTQDIHGNLTGSPRVPNSIIENNTTLPISVITGAGANRSGLIFKFPVTMNAAGTVLDPPTITDASIVVVHNSPTGTPVSDFPVRVAMVPETQPADYSMTDFPGERDEENVLVDSEGDLTTEQIIPGTLADKAIITLPLHGPTINLLVQKSNWNGRMAFTLSTDEDPALFDGINFFSSENTTETAPTLEVTYCPFHTGLVVGAGVDRGERAVFSMRSGLPANASDLVEDGTLKGVWVLPGEEDPDRNENDVDKYIPNPNEGGRPDDIPT